MSKGLYSKRHLKGRVIITKENVPGPVYWSDTSHLYKEFEADWGENNMCKPRNYLWIILIAIILLVIGVKYGR